MNYLSLPSDGTDSAEQLCNRACRIANSRKLPVHFTSAGVQMEVQPDEEPDDCFSRWWKGYKALQKSQQTTTQLT